MPRVLVTYGSKHGATAAIAEAIGATLRDEGVDADVVDAGAARSLDGYSAAVVGSAVYAAHWRGEALRFLRKHHQWLSEHPVWLFSSGPVGEDDPDADPEEVDRFTRPKKVQQLAGELSARDHAVFGGMVDDDRGLIRKRMARGMPEEARDRRDWDEIAQWASGVAKVLLAETPPS